MRSPGIPIEWVRGLAAPYLRGCRPRAERRGSLRGWRFLCPHRGAGKAPGGAEAGFFVGYLLEPSGFEFLDPAPPECLVFSYVHPAGGAAHGRLVAAPDALLRRTSEYIRWLTHRPPRFEFYTDALAALVRHQTMGAWPAEKLEHFSRNFFIETLAWLARSGLVRRLLAASR